MIFSLSVGIPYYSYHTASFLRRNRSILKDLSIAVPSGDGRKERQVETVITASPHAFDPVAHHNLPLEEQEKVYSRRVNEIIRPYTVIDVLTKVYHRNFANDLSAYIGEHPKAFASFRLSASPVLRIPANKSSLIMK